MSPRTIWHFPLDPSPGWQEVELPKGARLLHYEGASLGYARFWVEVDPEAEPEMRRVGVFGTGWLIPEGGAYVHTHIGPTGYVWHLYDGGPTEPETEGERDG